LGQLALGLGVVACRGAYAATERAVYAGIETEAATGVSRAAFFSATGARLGRTALDFRAHGLAEYGATLIVFPRRPGNRFSLIDRETLAIKQVVTAPPERHFYGHGAFTVDGQHLVVTENDLDTLEGGLGVYRVSDMARLGTIILPQAGPHEIIRHPSRDLFYVAVGGLETHPAYGRTPLNLGAFRSQIVSFDFATSEVSEMGFWAGSEGISLRHLAMDAQERLYVGGQVADAQRGVSENVLWLVQGGSVERLEIGAKMKGYISSVAAFGQEARISSKESGMVLSLNGAEALGEVACDGAGALGFGAGVEAYTGFVQGAVNGVEVEAVSGTEFDNHGLVLL
jgi:hypothetical protein